MDYVIGGIFYLGLVGAITYGALLGDKGLTLGPPASLPRRFLARLIDGLIIMGPFFVWGLAAAVLGTLETDLDEWAEYERQTVQLAALTLTVVYLVVEAAFTALAGGTPGKLILGLRIVDPATGRWPSPLRSVLRAGAYTVAGLPPFLLGFVAITVPALGDAARRGLHDRLARTAVVCMSGDSILPGGSDVVPADQRH